MAYEKIAVITDTAADLPEEYVLSKENLYILPLRLSIEEKSLADKREITTEEVLLKMESGVIPKTSLPSPEDAEGIFKTLREKGIRKAICVHITAGLSGTIAMMRLLAEQYKAEMDVLFYDTKILSMSEGYMVMNALELIENGCPFDKLLERMDALRKDVDGFFYIPTLKYLAVGGRIGKVAKYLGNLMNIKPVIGCDDEGRYYPRKICIGAKKTLLTARDECRNFVQSFKAEITVLHAGAREEAEKLVGVIQSVCSGVRISISELTPSLSVHVGRGMMAVCTRRFTV